MCNNNESILTEQDTEDLEQNIMNDVIEEATNDCTRCLDYTHLATIKDIRDLAEEVGNIEALILILDIMIDGAETREKLNTVIAELVDEATIE